MEKAKEILRLHYQTGLNLREIAASVGCSPGTVSNVLNRFNEAGLEYPVELCSKELGSLLYPPKEIVDGTTRAEPDMEYIHREMQKKGVTLTLLWEEYKTENPGGLMYTQFCKRYRQFRKQNNVYMRKIYKAGDQMMVDWAGLPMSYTDDSGEHEVYMFVANLPASSYIYAEPFRDKKLNSWIDGHVNALEYYGGVPRLIIPDNESTAVSYADYYDPKLNQTYADLARHYGVGIVPTKIYSPTHKSPVEKGVQIVERRIIAKLRKRLFTSYEELCMAVEEELEAVNSAPFQKMPGSRKELFKDMERHQLQPLPATRYECPEWKKAKVGNDYHIQYGRKNNVFFYSVPYAYAHNEVDVRITTRMVEIFCDGDRIAVHQRKYSGRNRYSTIPEHMPDNHRVIMEWSPKRFIRWAGKIGPNTQLFIENLLNAREFPEQAYKTCQGILRLSDDVATEQMEQACKAALEQNIYTYKSFKILLSNRDKAKVITHDNVRGSSYYGGDSSAR